MQQSTATNLIAIPTPPSRPIPCCISTHTHTFYARLAGWNSTQQNERTNEATEQSKWEKIAKKMHTATTTTTGQMKGQRDKKKSNQCDVCASKKSKRRRRRRKNAQNRHSAKKCVCREREIETVGDEKSRKCNTKSKRQSNCNWMQCKEEESAAATPTEKEKDKQSIVSGR